MRFLHRSFGPVRHPLPARSVGAVSTALAAVLVHGVALVGLLSATPASGQETESTFGEVIDVRVVNLEVVVTEDGERVRNLGPEDFLLEVDGQEVPIEYFTEVHGGVAVTSADEGQLETLPALAPGERVGTSFLVFIDEFFTIERDRDRVIDGLIQQLPNLQVEDRMAIVAYDGKSVDMLSNWTNRVDTLTSVLRRAKARKAYGLFRTAELRGFETRQQLVFSDTLDDPRRPGREIGLDIEEESYARNIARQVENAVKAAAATLRGFANPPGRKVMMVYSGGWPFDPVQWVITDPERAVRAQSFQFADNLLEPLTETANRLSYTVYSIDAPGLRSGAIDASVGTLDRAEAIRRDNRVREQEEDFSLLQLAERTGGQAFLNGTEANAFERVVSDTRSYYWVGFTPTWQGDDTEHDVKLTVRRKGADVRTRQGYSDLSRETEVTMMVESALLFGDAPSAAPLAIQVGRGKRAGLGKRNVPLSIQVPLDQLTFLPTADGYLAEVELRVAVLDDTGNTADVPVIPLSLTSKRLPEANESTLYETQVRLRNRKHDMVVSLYDRVSGKILSSRVTVGER